MSVFLAPTFGAGYQAFNANGQPLNAGLIYTYQAGTSTPLGTYTSSLGTIANANPIVLGTDGRPPYEIWLTSGIAYKFVLQDSLNNTIATYDNVSGINDITSSSSFGEWTATGLTPTYQSTTSFTVPGNQTLVFAANGRVKTINTGGTIYSTIQSVSYSAGTGLTTIVVASDSGTLDSGLSSVAVSFLNPSNPSIPGEYMAFNSPVSLVAASTVNIGAQASANITITGSATILAFDSMLAGVLRYVKFTGNCNLTNSVNIVLPQTPTMSVQAGDEMVFRSLGSGNWECIQFTPSLNMPTIGGAHTLANTDKGQILNCSGTFAISGTPSTLGAGWFCYISNGSTGTITLNASAGFIYQLGGATAGVTSCTIPDSGTGANPYNNSMIMLSTDGTNFYAVPYAPHGAQTFLASGSWTAPKGVFTVWLTGSGPGGNGGGGGGNGFAGVGGSQGQKILKQRYSVVPGTAYSIIIGPVGGNTSFGALLTLSSGANGASSVLTDNTGTNGQGDGGGLPGYGAVSGGNAIANSGSGGGGAGGGVATSGGAGASGFLTVEW